MANARKAEPPIRALPHGGSHNLNWMEDAACQGSDSRQFFPETPGDHDAQVKQVVNSFCSRCPVSGDCLQYGKDIGATAGIFGGKEFLSKKAERDRIRAQKKYQPKGKVNV